MLQLALGIRPREEKKSALLLLFSPITLTQRETSLHWNVRRKLTSLPDDHRAATLPLELTEPFQAHAEVC
jgi:hypothetical protein